ncbi:hypothetical protein ACFE04_005235 [Oxalis oulophora]
MFEFLGDGIFNEDYDSLRLQRNMIQAMINNKKFELHLGQTVYEKVMNGLIPVLEYFAHHEMEMDLQDILQRFTFDNIYILILGYDPKCLSVELPEILHEKAFDDMEEATLYRHIYGSKIRVETSEMVANWRREKAKNCCGQEDFMKTDKFLREIAFNLMAAGRDTVTTGISWFFYLVATHPAIDQKILEEIKSDLPKKEYSFVRPSGCTRLYPSMKKMQFMSILFQVAIKSNPKTRILILFYAMPRMPYIWGEYCLEFKPERWISDEGNLIYVPSYKFTAFNCGPRTCLGKDMSFIQMKMVAIMVLWHYHIRIVEGHTVSPSHSIILSMANGFKVKLIKRFVCMKRS